MKNQNKHIINRNLINIGTEILFDGLIFGVIIKIKEEVVTIRLSNHQVERLVYCSRFEITRMVH